MNRRGVTLIELLLGLVLLALVGIAITGTLLATSRVAVRSTQALSIARTMLATGALVREELGNSAIGEVRPLGPNAVGFARTVGRAAVCDVQGSVVRLPAADWLGTRSPEGGRDAAVLLTDIPSGRWLEVPIDTVGSGRCPDGSAAIRLNLGSPAGTAVFVRIVEPVQLRAYLSGGSGWWGLAPASGAAPVQPFAGPLDTPLQPVMVTALELALSFRPSRGAAAKLRIPLGLP